MRQQIKHWLLISFGWLCVLLAVLGALLPLLPTTPFLILALACFAESSPRFHQMLLNHRWFGPPLHQWQQSHTIRRTVKFKAMLLIVISFAISILILWGRPALQLMLVALCLLLLGCVFRLKESEPD